ncbi:hypothetical protein [Mycolicibacterium sp. XJ883]
MHYLELFLLWVIRDSLRTDPEWVKWYPEHPAMVASWEAKLDRKLNPPTPQRPVVPASEVNAGRRRSYALTGLSNELGTLSETREGNRNDQLNISAFKIARFVRDGLLTRDEAVGPLREVAVAIGLPSDEVDNTLRSAFGGADAKGLTTTIPDREGYGSAYQLER